MYRETFFSCIENSIFTSFTYGQVYSINAIFDECTDMTDDRQIAYILGTAYHETAHKMLPIEEIGKGEGRPYGRKQKQSGAMYRSPDKLYYGRGFVQLTWYENYERMGKILKLPLLEQPELALDTKVAAKILVVGMRQGLFTGKKLDDYFNDTKEDWVNARRIVNGLDRANIIANYSKQFLRCLKGDEL